MTSKRFIRFRICSAALFCWGGMQSCAATTADLLKQSNAVAIATPNNVTNRADGIAMNLSIASWLLAPASPVSSVQILWSTPNASQTQGFHLPAAPKPGIWFLKDLGNGFYAPLPVRYPSGFSDLYFEAAAPGNCPTAFAYAAGDSLTERIAMELACAASFEATTGYPSGGMVSATCDSGTSARVRQAATYLAGMPGARQKSIGIACLLSANDPSGMALLEKHIQELNDQDSTNIVARAVVGWANPDVAAVNSLGAIAVRPSTGGILLKFTATALASIHTVDTIPWFDKLLDRNEKDAQMEAIKGLVQFINGYPIRTVENFKDMSFMKPSPTLYSADNGWKGFTPKPDASDVEMHAAISFWKAWLRTNRLVQ